MSLIGSYVVKLSELCRILGIKFPSNVFVFVRKTFIYFLFHKILITFVLAARVSAWSNSKTSAWRNVRGRRHGGNVRVSGSGGKILEGEEVGENVRERRSGGKMSEGEGVGENGRRRGNGGKW